MTTDDHDPFPSEAEWLSLPAPPIGAGFVDRTLDAVRRDRADRGGDHADAPAAAEDLPAELLAHFAPPPPSSGFVDRTLRAVTDDRRRRWRELLARHVAPDPSPEFVARTLRALALDRGADVGGPAARPTRHRRWLPFVLLAAAAAAVVALLPRPGAAPLELRIAQGVPPAFAHAYAASPLPAALARLAADDDGLALPDANVDGAWLLAGGVR